MTTTTVSPAAASSSAAVATECLESATFVERGDGVVVLPQDYCAVPTTQDVRMSEFSQDCRTATTVEDRHIETSVQGRHAGAGEQDRRAAAVSQDRYATPDPQTRCVPCASQDRRITRSKRALRSALISLMEERSFDGFTVNDLCERADLNRGTFYNHFRDKDDLVSQLEAEVISDLDQLQAQMQHLSVRELLGYQALKKPLPLLTELFDYLRYQGAFLHAVLGPGGDVAFAPRLRDSVCTNLVESILHERYRNDPTPFVGYYVAFFASAYLGVITRWIETGMQESSEEMALIAMRLFFIKPGESITL